MAIRCDVDFAFDRCERRITHLKTASQETVHSLDNLLVASIDPNVMKTNKALSFCNLSFFIFIYLY